MIELDFLKKKYLSSSNELLLVDLLGGFFFYSPRDLSKYQGLFFNDKMNLYKSLDFIKVKDSSIKKIIYKNNNTFEVIHKDFYENYEYIKEEGVLIYKTDNKSEISFIFDSRLAYDMSKWGRYYDVYLEDGTIIVHYKKRKDEKENNDYEYDIYTAIFCENAIFKKLDHWEEKSYFFDQSRNDSPQRATYQAISLKGNKFSICSSLSKKEAIKKSKKAFYKKIKLEKLNPLYKTSDIKIDYAYNLSLKSLNSFKLEKFLGVYAGLPWFFQFWTRDTAFSIKSLYYQDKIFTKKLILKYISLIRKDGLTPNILPNLGNCSIDGTGILFHRIGEIINTFTNEEKNKIMNVMYNSLKNILSTYSKGGLINSSSYETWMDTIERENSRIEVQAIYLSSLSVLKKISKKQRKKEIYEFASKNEDLLKKKVREKFYNDSILSDGLDDKTIRPNIFMSYYFYPELLSNNEWEKVFDKALEKLWLDWGGLSTVNRADIRFTDKHTGTNNLSYHNGDSWFFINNLTAIVLNRLNSKKYNFHIKKIIDASTEEIINKGILGYHAELSSASKFESNGCLAQTWSSALYLELIKELFD